MSSIFVVPLAPSPLGNSAARRGPRSPKGLRPEPPLLSQFVGDDDNRLIRVVIASFLAEPRYNPVVIVGPQAVGKSILTTGLADRWNDAHPDRPALLLPAAELARGYADAFETDSLQPFRRRFLQAGAVVLDGLEQIADKTSAQLELARLLDLLCDQRTPTLLTCRTDPEMPQFHPALWSRLHGGLLTPLLPPGSAARRKILGELLQRRRVRIQPAALDFLTDVLGRDTAIQPTVVQLAEVVQQLAATTEDDRQPWCVARLQASLTERVNSSAITVADIARLVADYFGLRVSDLKGSSRRRQVVRARALATYLARQTTGQSLESLGQFFGGRDHTTTLHACRSTEELLKTDPFLQQAAAAIVRRFSSTDRSRRTTH